MMERKRFAEISHKELQHEWDRNAFDHLTANKETREHHSDFCRNRFLDVKREAALRFELLASAVRLDSHQCADIYEIVVETCSTLDTLVPDVFVKNDSTLNASVFPITKPILCLTAGLVDALSDEEIRFVVGHELGHVKCGHASFHSLAGWFNECELDVSKLDENERDGVTALLDWDRKSELSADRAGLLAVQNLDVALVALAKLATGSQRVCKTLNMASFLKQAVDLETSDAGALPYVYELLGPGGSHPWPVFRASALGHWASSPDYERILRGEYEKRGPAHLQPPLIYVTDLNCLLQFIEALDLRDVSPEPVLDHATRLDAILKAIEMHMGESILPENCHIDVSGGVPKEIKANFRSVAREIKKDEKIRVICDHAVFRPGKKAVALTERRVLWVESDTRRQCMYDEIQQVDLELNKTTILITTKPAVGRIVQIVARTKEEARLLKQIIWKVAVDNPTR